MFQGFYSTWNIDVCSDRGNFSVTSPLLSLLFFFFFENTFEHKSFFYISNFMISQLQINCITSDWICSASGDIYLSKILPGYPVLLKLPSDGSKASVDVKYTQYISCQRTLKKESLSLGGGAVVPFLLTRVLTNIRSLVDRLGHQKNKKEFKAM